MKTKLIFFTSRAESCAGARASARFNFHCGAAQNISTGLALRTLKRFRTRDCAPRRSERGSATMVFIVLLAIMMILVLAESRALFHLHREVKFLEQQQIKRLNGPATNSVAIIIAPQK